MLEVPSVMKEPMMPWASAWEAKVVANARIDFGDIAEVAKGNQDVGAAKLKKVEAELNVNDSDAASSRT